MSRSTPPPDDSHVETQSPSSSSYLRSTRYASPRPLYAPPVDGSPHTRPSPFPPKCVSRPHSWASPRHARTGWHFSASSVFVASASRWARQTTHCKSLIRSLCCRYDRPALSLQNDLRKTIPELPVLLRYQALFL